ncbi:serine/threonine-protein kinase [Rhodococcus wratislaviensis]|uniref:non-specific serine/threonine protein kinase n=1 Tax=Rhodococcus wratislaviensis NBRC 100605 TaxID=1219028 RepID=X0Q086_RHOWR|nr:serine/threonine-protein kinase [Rhodococcus wratislaviensis]GAF49409.1 hypothetical protein RW1_081_00060 [Rhodococcus wratislaviensis NBRC 100605]
MGESVEPARVGEHFGHYRLDKLLGRGGMGEVYEAYDEDKDRVVALKLLLKGLAEDSTYRKRFKRESHAAARLQEPHVIPIHDYGEIDGILFIDMRLVRGEHLGRLIAEHGILPPARAVNIIGQTASALDAAHADGLIHRDITPGNILVTRDDFAYLVDFGITKEAGAESITMTNTMIGTLAYMAPERFAEDAATPSVDIYSLTCVLHQCLTGSQPYPTSSVPVAVNHHLNSRIPRPSSIRPGVPVAFDPVIRRGMAKKPEERYRSAGELAAAAHAALTAPVRLHSREPTLRAGPPIPRSLLGNPPTAPWPSLRQPDQATAPPTQPDIVDPSGGERPPSFLPPGGPPPMGPPPGGPPPIVPPPRGKAQPVGARGKRSRYLAATLLVLAVLGGFWFFTTRSGDDEGQGGGATTTRTASKTASATVPTTAPTTRPPTTTPVAQMPGPATPVTVLFGRLPQGYSPANCSPGDFYEPAIAGLDCRAYPAPGGPTGARMYLYGNVPDVETSLREVVTDQAHSPLACPGGGQDPADWYRPNDPTKTAVGQYVCAQSEGHPRIIWTNEHEQTMGIADGPDMPALFTWWEQNR